MHKSSHSKMEWFKDNYLDTQTNLKILDVGSLDIQGGYNYSDIFNELNWEYTGLDYVDGDNVDIVVTDIYNWFEVEDRTYDVVISGQFFEQLEFFWLTMSQIEKVLKPGGYVCIITPSDGPKHGGGVEKCYKFHEEGLKALAKYVNLEVLHASLNDTDEAKPWHDTCLVAHKEGITQEDAKELESRVNNLEGKLDSILEAINKK